MCRECFEKEYQKFSSENEWLDFDFQLTVKLSKKQMAHLNSRTKGENIYKCKNCQALWKLMDPDGPFRGYFLKIL